GRAQAELEQRDEALATGQHLGPGVGADDREGLLDRGRTVVGERCRDHAWPPFEPCIARHTVCGVYGMSRWRIPSGLSASITALATAAVLAIAPAPRTLLPPSGLTGDGVTVSSSSMFGRYEARGTV